MQRSKQRWLLSSLTIKRKNHWNINLFTITLFSPVFLSMFIILPALHGIYLKILIKFWRLKRRASHRLRDQRGEEPEKSKNFFKSIFKIKSPIGCKQGSFDVQHDETPGKGFTVKLSYNEVIGTTKISLKPFKP